MTEPVTAEAAIVDFDGTLVDLPIDWRRLRAQLGVTAIDNLFDHGSADMWSIVRQQEIRAAQCGEPRERVIELLAHVPWLAILTANSEDAVSAFLERRPDLAPRVVAIVGRETAQGPKRDEATFVAAFDRCRSRLRDCAGQDITAVYVGDQDYELRFAAALGAPTIDARRLI